MRSASTMVVSRSRRTKVLRSPTPSVVTRPSFSATMAIWQSARRLMPRRFSSVHSTGAFRLRWWLIPWQLLGVLKQSKCQRKRRTIRGRTIRMRWRISCSRARSRMLWRRATASWAFMFQGSCRGNERLRASWSESRPEVRACGLNDPFERLTRFWGEPWILGHLGPRSSCYTNDVHDLHEVLIGQICNRASFVQVRLGGY